MVRIGRAFVGATLVAKGIVATTDWATEVAPTSEFEPLPRAIQERHSVVTRLFFVLFVAFVDNWLIQPTSSWQIRVAFMIGIQCFYCRPSVKA